MNYNYKLLNGDSNLVLDTLIEKKIIVDHIITDPPFNISKKNNFSSMKNAKRVGVDFGEWDKEFNLISWIPKAAKLLSSGGTFIIFNSYRNLTPIINELESSGLIVKDLIRWVKNNPMPRNIRRRYVQDCEYAVWAIKPKKPWVFNLPKESKYLRAQFQYPVVSGKEKLDHPTQKSLKLMNDIISIHTNENDLILDPFMGSGTTGIAAISLKRRFIGVELDENYYELVRNRFKNLENDNNNRVTQ